jgi:hypothetical protein
VSCRRRPAARHHPAATTRRARRSSRRRCTCSTSTSSRHHPRRTTRLRPWRRARLRCPWACRGWARRGPQPPRPRLASTARPRPRRRARQHQGRRRQAATGTIPRAASPGRRSSRRRPTAPLEWEAPCARRRRPCRRPRATLVCMNTQAFVLIIK